MTFTLRLIHATMARLAVTASIATNAKVRSRKLVPVLAVCLTLFMVAAFRRAVPVIVGVGPKKEMPWVNTAAIVAAVENTHQVWDGASVYLIRKPMRQDSHALVRQVPVSIRPHEAVEIQTPHSANARHRFQPFSRWTRARGDGYPSGRVAVSAQFLPMLAAKALGVTYPSALSNVAYAHVRFQYKPHRMQDQ